MAWKFREASYRNVPFYVDVSTRSSGRALVAHDVPHGDGEIWEDVGPEIDVFSVEAYLVSPPSEAGFAQAPFLPAPSGGGVRATRAQFHAWRDQLLEALETAGPAVLRHPLFGVVLARARRWTVSESRTELWFARLSIEFVRDREQSGRIAPSSSSDGAAARAGDAVEQAAGGRLTNELATGAVAESARTSTANEITKLSARLRSLDRFTAVGQRAAEFARKAVSLARDAKSLAMAPANLVLRVTTAIRDVERAVSDAAGALGAYQTLLRIAPTFIGSGAADRNAALVIGLVRSAAIGGALRAAVRVTWDSHEQAIAARDRMIAIVDELSLTASDAEHQALCGMLVALVRLVPPEDEQLPRLGAFTPAKTTAALLIAWRLYADVEREAEIVARNRIRHPGLVPGGRTLQVLVDASR